MRRTPWIFYLTNHHRMAQWHRFWCSLPPSLQQTDDAAQDWLHDLFFDLIVPTWDAEEEDKVWLLRNNGT